MRPLHFSPPTAPRDRVPLSVIRAASAASGDPAAPFRTGAITRFLRTGEYLQFFGDDPNSFAHRSAYSRMPKELPLGARQGDRVVLPSFGILELVVLEHGPDAEGKLHAVLAPITRVDPDS